MRIVLNTNQLVRALARPPEFATFVMAWSSARFTVICSNELLDEYEHVLSRSYIRALIYPESLRAFRNYLVDIMDLIELKPFTAICRDPDDDKVWATAIQGGADYLLTADSDLMTDNVRQLLEQAGIHTATIDEFIVQIDTHHIG
jgi:putative PIN family toxin of toxin-antitoxin system